MGRVVVIRTAEDEMGRVEWDGAAVTVTGVPDLVDDLLMGVGPDDLKPEDGEVFLDEVLDEYGRGSRQWAEEAD